MGFGLPSSTTIAKRPLLGSKKMMVGSSWVVTKRAHEGRIMVTCAMLSPKEDILLLRRQDWFSSREVPSIYPRQKNVLKH